MRTEDWKLFKVFTDRFEAERVVGLLESSGVPAYVDFGGLGVGLEMRFSVSSMLPSPTERGGLSR
jgi:hypothetical protein